MQQRGLWQMPRLMQPEGLIDISHKTESCTALHPASVISYFE